MRQRWFLFLLLAGSLAVHAGETLRIGSQVLVVGDSAVRVVELLGDPLIKVPIQNEYAAYVGERWQYKQGDHVVTVTLVNGRVSDISDRPS